MDTDERRTALVAGALMALCFATGGSSQQTGIGTALAQLASLPILVHAVLRTRSRGGLRAFRAPIVVAVLIASIPWLQLVPIPSWLWSLPPARVALAHDLAAAGVEDVSLRWSLSPAATERDALSMLPPLALFFCALAVDRGAWRGLCAWLVALCACSLLLGFAQSGVAQDSVLNPFPQYAPALAGVFANRNHQAVALTIGLVLSVALLVDARRRGTERGGRSIAAVPFALSALLLAVALPLVGSRAGIVIAMIAIGVVLPAAGVPSLARLREHRPTRWATAAVLGLLVAGIHVGLAWVQSDAAVTGSRWMLSRETLRIAVDNMPLGSGFGSFVPMFQQGTGPETLARTYINAAHDEYAQWGLEGGVLVLGALFAAVIVLARVFVRLVRRHPESPARTIGVAAWSGVFALLVHSGVDYPLRTPALMAACALLAGIAVAAAGAPSTRDGEMSRKRVVA
ncbi:O-antigen ligase family protein, partial [Dokdonella sp.]|uniref:O-antigen ligase family protein n=1 Tax=Dokdonella sp. TaxID=2291710 RepID=UPI002F41AA00